MNQSECLLTLLINCKERSQICLFFAFGDGFGVKVNMVIHRINVRRLNPSGIVKLLNLNYFLNGELQLDLLFSIFLLFREEESRRAETVLEGF